MYQNKAGHKRLAVIMNIWRREARLLLWVQAKQPIRVVGLTHSNLNGGAYIYE